MVLVKNDDRGIVRMGISPRWKGMEFEIPIVMVGDASGASIEKSGTAKFERSREGKH